MCYDTLMNGKRNEIKRNSKLKRHSAHILYVYVIYVYIIWIFHCIFYKNYIPLYILDKTLVSKTLWPFFVVFYNNAMKYIGKSPPWFLSWCRRGANNAEEWCRGGANIAEKGCSSGKIITEE